MLYLLGLAALSLGIFTGAHLRPEERPTADESSVDVSWQNIVRHEAAHAAASICLTGTAAPIGVRVAVDENGVRTIVGAFQMPMRLGFGDQDNVLNNVIIAAAGAMAEFEHFGVKSAACEQDQAHIDALIKTSNDEEARNERYTGYPTTRALVKRLAPHIFAIAGALELSLKKKDFVDSELVGMVELLSTDEILQAYESADSLQPVVKHRQFNCGIHVEEH